MSAEFRIVEVMARRRGSEIDLYAATAWGEEPTQLSAAEARALADFLIQQADEIEQEQP